MNTNWQRGYYLGAKECVVTYTSDVRCGLWNSLGDSSSCFSFGMWSIVHVRLIFFEVLRPCIFYTHPYSLRNLGLLTQCIQTATLTPLVFT